MNIKNFDTFRKDFLVAISFDGSKFNEENWLKFLHKYFDNDEVHRIHQEIIYDLTFFRKHDPASQEYFFKKILQVRRGMMAVVAHRVFQHILSQDNSRDVLYELEFIDRFVQEVTDIEIHPSVKIGQSFAIDHGHGTVIGQTTEIGDRVFLYHGITLGATGNHSKEGRRHPKIGNDIFFGSGSQILGPSILKNNIVVGAEAIVVDSIVESNVKISPAAVISRAVVPQGYHVFAYDPLSQQHIVREASDKTYKKVTLEKVEIKDL